MDKIDQVLELIDKLDNRVTALEKKHMTALELVDTVFMDDSLARHIASNPATRPTSSEDSNE